MNDSIIHILPISGLRSLEDIDSARRSKAIQTVKPRIINPKVEEVEDKSFNPYSLDGFSFDKLIEANELPPYRIINEVKPAIIYGKESVLHGTIKTESSIHEKSLQPGIIALATLAISLMFFIYSKKIVSILFMAAINDKLAKKQFEENISQLSMYRKFFFLLSILILTIFLSILLLKGLIPEKLSILHFGSVFLFISGLILIQNNLLKLCGVVSLSETVTKEINFHRELIFGLGGFLLIPLILISLLYLGNKEIAVYVSLIILTALFVHFHIRTFLIFSKARISIFFWFLYLCTFEICPILLLYIAPQANALK